METLKIWNHHVTLSYHYQEAKDAFKSLLQSTNIQSDWTWEQVGHKIKLFSFYSFIDFCPLYLNNYKKSQAMRLIINDKRYGALKTLGERKQAFSQVQSQNLFTFLACVLSKDHLEVNHMIRLEFLNNLAFIC